LHLRDIYCERPQSSEKNAGLPFPLTVMNEPTYAMTYCDPDGHLATVKMCILYLILIQNVMAYGSLIKGN
jgi:hypothetical protein